MPGVADAAFRAGLALADRAGGFALVSDDAAVPADRSRRLGRGRRAATAGACRLDGGKMLRKLYDWTLDLAAHPHATWWLAAIARSEEHTSELQSLMRSSYAVFCLK